MTRPPLSKKPLMMPKEVSKGNNEEKKCSLNLKSVHISLDPASHAFGVAVFGLDGKFIDSFTVKVSEGVIPTMRLYFMRKKFIDEWEARYGLECIATLAVIEHLPPSNCAVLQNAGGAILSSGKISSELSHSEYIVPSVWKCFCRELGDRNKSPKGISALNAIGWEYALPDSDDAADAILIYLTSRWRKRQRIWLGEGKFLESWFVPKKWIPKSKKVSKK